jgi:putative hydrolase of the HAD superfamily
MIDLLSQIKELHPIDPKYPCDLSPLSDIKCVLFDIYGTLIISASGDIGSSELIGQSALQTFEHCNIQLNPNNPKEDIGRLIISEYEQEIRNSHNISREKGILHPEVNILNIWENVIAELYQNGVLLENQDIDINKLSFTFEFYNNPVYPMPNFIQTLESLSLNKYKLGIVSNAQYFTPMFLNHFISDDFEKTELPWFDKNIVTYSFQHEIAKPDLYLYQKTKEEIEKMGLEASQCLFIGNDMLNDIYPASAVGFKTALFAGDLRSLRLRKNHQNCKDLKPDCVINNLNQINTIIGNS